MSDALWQDLRYAARSLRRAPGFAAVVVVTLALGIGANTAIFSLMDAVMFKPLPVPKPGELWTLHVQAPGADPDLSGGTGRWLRFSYSVAQSLERALPPDASLAAFTRVTPYDVRRDGTLTETVGVQLASGHYFSTFGVSAIRGRLIGDADNAGVDAHPVAVVSYTYWQQALGGTASVIGQTLRVNNLPVTIIGVTTAGFTGPSSEEAVSIWLPLMMQHTVHYANNSSSYGTTDIEQQPWAPQDAISWLNVTVRARTGLGSVAPRLDATYRSEMRRLASTVSQVDVRNQLALQTLGFERFTRGFSTLRRQYATALTMLMALVGLVLLIACANIANLLLVRAAGQERHLRIRLALGGSRARLTRQLLAEALMLTGAGTAAALLVARAISLWIASRVLNVEVAALPPAFAQDHRVLAFAVCVGIIATVAFAVGPAVIATRRIGLAVSMRSTAATLTMTSMRPLIAIQVAIALLLGVTAAWFGQSLLKVWHVTPGFEPARLVAVSINSRNSGYVLAELPGLYQRLVGIAQSVPGVESAVIAACGLSEGCQSINRFRIENRDDRTPDGMEMWSNYVGPHYFATIGVPLLEGREFDEHDVEDGPGVAIVSRSMVARYFGGRSPLGQRIGYRLPGRAIIGVVDDARVEELHVAPVPMVYMPIAQSTAYANTLDVRVTGEPRLLAQELRQAIARHEPKLAVSNALTLDDRLERNVARDTLLMYLTTGFALLALLLSSLGLYSVLAYLVAKRTGEIGIRMALGARPIDVRQMVVADGMRQVFAGLMLGLVATIGAGQIVRSMLFEVSPAEPATYGAMLVILAAVGFMACYLPARRASRVDPVTALRAE